MIMKNKHKIKIKNLNTFYKLYNEVTKMEQIDYYLIQKAWQLRGTEEFDDLETAKLIIRGEINV